MQMPNRRGWLAILFIIVTLAVPFAITYYVSTQPFRERHDRWRQASADAGLPSRSKQKQDRIFLVKDEKLVIGKTGLVYLGVSGGLIRLELYLLELDPAAPYPVSVPKKKAEKGFWLGNVQYQLVSVKKTVLQLKIKETFNTR